LIPKIIHYIWIGSEIPNHIQTTIDKNSGFFTEYEVKIWTEKNMPKLNAFAQRAYDEEKWAFVSDYLRFIILKQYGGIYLDTDMEVLKSLDNLLENRCFSGWNRRNTHVYAGIIGAEINNEYIGNIVEHYNHIHDKLYPTSPEVMTECYNNYDKKETLNILPSRYFYPLLDGEKPTERLLEDAYTNHLWAESWRSYVPLRRMLRRVGLMKIYHTILHKIKG
jgi:mannosyltransferase OCH1-like enzyme